MSGGGGESGGVVVGGPAPWAAGTAGQLQMQAANLAAVAAEKQTNQAINLIREQYGTSFRALKPYTKEGIQALNELNQYMGLTPYDPGTAPKAPEVPNYDKILGDVTREDIDQYKLNHNLYVDNPFGYNWVYTGVGSHLVPDSTHGHGARVPGTGPDGLNEVVGPQGLIAQELARKQLKADQKEYESKYPLYQEEMDIYNYANELNDKYTEAGPLTPEQVSNKLANTPGYQFQLNQGVDAISRAASSKGLLNSGRLLQSLVDYSSGLAQQTYGDTLNRLAGLAGMGQNAAIAQAGGSQQLGNQLAGYKINLGETQANSLLAGSQAAANAITSGNMEYKVIGGGGGGGGIGSALSGVGSIIGGLSGLFSSKQLKDRIDTPSTKEILDRVNELKIDRWIYKGLDHVHIGPYAEDFQKQFQVGDGQTINLIDMLGVLFASVQELSHKIDTMQKENSHGN